MCGIVAVYCENNKYNLSIIKQLMIESQIRGKHSTGISYIDSDGNLQVYKDRIPSSDFVESEYWDKFQNDVSNCSMIKFIGHTRYATSGEDIQPINVDRIPSSLVLNGVITQSAPTEWGMDFDMSGHEFYTDNDAEILLELLSRKRELAKEHSKHLFSASYALLTSDGDLTHLRTNDRPSHIHVNEGFTAVASTKEILKRSGINSFIRTIPGVEYNLSTLSTTGSIKFCNDLQTC